MSFLNEFEGRIGSIFGEAPQGYTEPFSFKKLAKRAAREMENETFEIDGVDTAPALYTVLVSSSDDSLMRPLYQKITFETAAYVAAEAQKKGYSFVGEPLVRFMVDPTLKSGKFAVFAENVDARTLADLRARLLYDYTVYPDVPVRHEIVRLSPAAYPCRRYIFIDPHYALHKAMLQRLLHFVINFNI